MKPSRPLRDEEKILFSTFWLPPILLEIAYMHGTQVFWYYGWELSVLFLGTLSSLILLTIGTILAVSVVREKLYVRCACIVVCSAVAGTPGFLWLMDALLER